MARLSSAPSAFATGNGHLPRPAPQQQQQQQQQQQYQSQTARDEATSTPSHHATWPPNRRRSLPDDPSLHPGGPRSLPSIALQSFTLGATLSTCLLASAYLALSPQQNPFHLPQTLWRLPLFFALLSTFHYLEFLVTATYNPPATLASSFLLFNNGRAYNIAHSLAAAEILLSHTLLPPAYASFLVNPWTITLGFLLVLIGQVVRTSAMAQAGTNFNHTPARTKREGHVLVTRGVYAWLRHPSYFGFFWWALGTQVLVGNKVCLLGYLGALWMFFWRRIRGEEVSLVEFFGEEYVDYRRRTGTGIPFIR